MTLETIIRSRGWNDNKFTHKEEPTQHLIEAYITPDWHVNVTTDPDIEQTLDNITAKFNNGFFKKNIQFDIENLYSFIIDHEIGHWKVCPFDKDYHLDIKQNIVNGLTSRGVEESIIKEYEPRLSNMFMDIIVNVLNAHTDEDYRNGMAQFYLKEGELSGKLSEMYSIFVDTQTRMSMPEKRLNSLVEQYSPNYKKTKKMTKKVIKLLTKTYNPFFYIDVDDFDTIYKRKRSMKRTLEDKQSWGKKAYNFARLLYKQIEQTPLTSPLSNFQKDPQYDGNKSEAPSEIDTRDPNEQNNEGNQENPNGQGGRDSQDSNQGDKEGDECEASGGQTDSNDTQGNKHAPGDGKQKSSSPTEDKGYEDYFKDDSSQPNTSYSNHNFSKISSNQFQKLDEIYQRKSQKFKFESDDQGHETNIKYMNHKRIRDISNANPKEIDFSRTLPKGRTLEFFKRTNPIKINKPQRQGQNDFGGYSLIVDSSGSMGWSRGQRDNKYDLCLTAAYSLLDAIEDDKHISAINFSLGTHYSGWYKKSEQEMVKQILFSYQGSNTSLDTKALDSLDNEAYFNYLALMISDGEIDYHDILADKIIQLDQGQGTYKLIQLDHKSEFSQKLEQNGIEVFYIQDPQDLVGLTMKNVQA